MRFTYYHIGDDGFKSRLISAIYGALARDQIKSYAQGSSMREPLDRVKSVWNAVAVTVCCIGAAEGTGYAFCGPRDKFDIDLGQEISLGRARKDGRKSNGQAHA